MVVNMPGSRVMAAHEGNHAQDRENDQSEYETAQHHFIYIACTIKVNRFLVTRCPQVRALT